jgi:hypothetical protein
MGHLMGLGRGTVVLPALEYLFHRVEQQVRRAPDAAHPRRGLALSQPRGLRHAPAGVAQDPAQEERLRRLRDAGGGRRDEQARAPLDHPVGLPHQDLPPRRRGADARHGSGLPGGGPDRPPRCTSSPRPRRSATTTTGRSRAGASSSSASDPRRSPSSARRARPTSFLDELVATRDRRDYARAMLERRGVFWSRVRASDARTRRPRPRVADAQTGADVGRKRLRSSSRSTRQMRRRSVPLMTRPRPVPLDADSLDEDADPPDPWREEACAMKTFTRRRILSGALAVRRLGLTGA